MVLPILLLLASLVRAEVEDLDTQLMRATVKISHDKSTATGFVLSNGKDERRILVTAAHVFEKSPDDETTVVFRSQESAGVYKKEPQKLVVRREGKPVWTQHPTEDVAAMWIVPPGGADLPKIPLALLASDELLRQHKVHPGETLACLGFPHKNEGNESGFPLLRTGPIASFPLVPTVKNKTFIFSANIFEGDSGGPVYLTRASQPNAADVQLIMGIVSSQRFLDEEAKMVYGTTKIRHRLGLANVVHASFIKETIDRLP
jgi:V8-like Glu-specific endopeptidase